MKKALLICSVIASIASAFYIHKKIKDSDEETIARMGAGESLYERRCG